MKTLHLKPLAVLVATLLPLKGFAQVNSGSDGHDGPLVPTGNLVIDMSSHPSGIYHYTVVNIPPGVSVTFTPNAANKPVVWLVQGDCVIAGSVNVSGKNGYPNDTGAGGPGGFRGGVGGSNPSPGEGPGGGGVGDYGGNASFASTGGTPTQAQADGALTFGSAGATYGNQFLVPLIGGSGGGGSPLSQGGSSGFGAGGGGGGAILIASNGIITVNGSIFATGGGSWTGYADWPTTRQFGGTGSGGSVRLVAASIAGTGGIFTAGSQHYYYHTQVGYNSGSGRVRFDTLSNTFGGAIGSASFTQGFQPIILPASGQGVQLAIASIAGNAVPGSPSGVQASPDVIIPAQQTNPIPIVVNCTNIPLNTSITVVIHSSSGADVQAVGINNAGTTAASTATISVNMPRGGGVIYAKAVTGVAGSASASSPDAMTRSIADTGWTADGERFAKMEITAALGSKQQITYVTESGKRYSLAAR